MKTVWEQKKLGYSSSMNGNERKECQKRWTEWSYLKIKDRLDCYMTLCLIKVSVEDILRKLKLEG